MTHLLAVLFCIISATNGSVIDDWRTFEIAVRDRQIAKEAARTRFSTLFPRLVHYAAQFPFTQRNRWVFPEAGCNIRDVGRGGFKPDSYYGSSPIKGYDFYDGNNHGGHPAYDIFAHDSNQDCHDDRTGAAIEVVAPVDLLVLSVNTGWNTASSLRGGNYIWAMHAPSSMIFYFAHLDSIVSMPGQFLRAGAPLGNVGRTGLNAHAKRSPTHLHFMVLRIDGTRLKPVDTWTYLLNSVPGTISPISRRSSSQMPR